MSFVSGTAAIISVSDRHGKAGGQISSMAVLLSYCLVYFALIMIRGTGLEGAGKLKFELFALNGLITMLIYPLIFLFGKNIYFLSDITLLELSDINNPLLRRFAEEAPGSFQHSLQVASLAEEAVRITGGNPLPARAGALYHDIWKVVNAGYFIENHLPGDDPYSELDPVKSSGIITGYVQE